MITTILGNCFYCISATDITATLSSDTNTLSSNLKRFLKIFNLIPIQQAGHVSDCDGIITVRDVLTIGYHSDTSYIIHKFNLMMLCV